MLMLLIDKLLEEAEDETRSAAVITYIDFTAAFDSISHHYLLKALRDYVAPLKYCRLVKAIYDSSKVRVRLQEPVGKKTYSPNINVRRGVIQGDFPSPVCFLVMLDKLLKDHGNLPNRASKSQAHFNSQAWSLLTMRQFLTPTLTYHQRG